MLQLLAPAKINLGLEVLGRRPDGFHEIRSILAAVSLFDRIDIAPADEFSLMTNDSSLNEADNLALRAALALGKPISIALRKRIPAAAGLGGASSDAASVLRGVSILHPGILEQSLHEAARALGSDVPFFLGAGFASVSARGDECPALPSSKRAWLALAVPKLMIPNKTATLYGSLNDVDFSDGARMNRVTEALIDDGELSTTMLKNAFERPLYDRWPEVKIVREAMLDAGAKIVALSGAGPAHYAICEDVGAAAALAANIRARVDSSVRLFVCRFLSGSAPLRSRHQTPLRVPRSNRT